MKNKSLLLFVMIFFTASILNVALSQTKVSTGDAVFAEWTPNSWYHGKAGIACAQGLTINFDDGDVKCCTTAQIVADVVPAASALKVGTKVLALWGNGKYYPGTVSAIAGNDYSINFDDGDKGKASLDHIRVK
ncbi:MAG: DUF4537 domain-containing protein [Spirochaetes bacterium]|nr:MAG: DUF4537 domain-containing protein [Spirochaetota bacterium]